ncbi:hypothetical protein [Taibaiella soli]|uniref:Uncharacterized protein n=1 Tax=Taibaiella soli TaxID=1649169 RepID=A0A2W2B9K8_9BACT|nr:hypothetical protein [Taibaiella soli]PZF72597.1 hypothetical protein DN068_12080 [Taibaiella soli]
MDTNDLIKSAFQNAGGILDGSNWYVLEGHVVLNEFRITKLDDFYINNLVAFKHGEDHGYVMLGIFNSIEAAEEYQIHIRTIGRDEKGNFIK